MMDQITAPDTEISPEEEESSAAKTEEGAPLVEFLKKFEGLPSHEEKLREAIGFMKASLAGPGVPFFKGFWEIRKLSLPLFKEGLTAGVRSELWEEYVALTREGRRLKDLLDRESAFASEQIEMAIRSLEVEVDGFQHYAEEVLGKTAAIAFPDSKILENKRDYYFEIQRRLTLLNTYASHIHALRKELMKTEMRVRHKNKFFERLSAMGDRIFPVRKELIKEISTSFVEDVRWFVEEHFSKENFSYDHVRRHVFFFREEIKALQAWAKVITLNTTAFTQTREQLSQCWDQLKGMEKDLKKEYTQQKQKSSENVGQVQKKLGEIAATYASGSLPLEEALREFEGVSKWMRDVELTHQDVKMLKEELRAARSLLETKKEEEEGAKEQQKVEQEEKRREALEAFKLRLQHVKEGCLDASIETLTDDLVSLKATLATLVLPKREKAVLEKTLKELRDKLEEKKEERLLNLSGESKAALDSLREILQQRKERRAEIKAQVEEYRKVIGGSSLDFEKAIEYGELMASEKERLEKMDESINEVEEKITALKKRL